MFQAHVKKTVLVIVDDAVYSLIVWGNEVVAQYTVHKVRRGLAGSLAIYGARPDF
jgi:hypothetical protein